MSQKQPKRMKGDFDPYYYFLGISPKDQPPDFYRLLGLERFESHVEIIEMAADRQMSHLHGAESGDHMDDVARLLSEVSRARLCLLSEKKKAEYDRQLQAHLDTLEVDDASTEESDDTPEQQQSWLDAAFMEELTVAEEAARPAMVSKWEVQARQLAAEQARLQSEQEAQQKQSSTVVVLAIVGGSCAALLLLATLIVAILVVANREQEGTADSGNSSADNESEVAMDNADEEAELAIGNADDQADVAMDNTGSDDPASLDLSKIPFTNSETTGTFGGGNESGLPDVAQVAPKSFEDGESVPQIDFGSDPTPMPDDRDSIENPLTPGDNPIPSGYPTPDPIDRDTVVADSGSKPGPAPKTTAQPQDNSDLRRWVSQDGEYSVEASYGGYKDEYVRLIKSDGESVPVRFRDLSDKDRQWVSEIEVDELLVEAAAYLDRQDGEQARETLFRGMQFSDDIRPDFYAGVIRAVMDKNTTLARRHFSNCVRHSPEHVPSLNNLAVAELWEKNNSQSAAYLKRALELDPACSEAAHNAGLLVQLTRAKVISLPATTQSFLEKNVSTSRFGYGRGGLQYMDYDDGANSAASKSSMAWRWASLADHRCFICNDTRKIDCPGRKCIKGTVKIPRKQITGVNTITGAPITKTIYVPTTCPTCRGAGSLPCRACSLVR